MPLRSRGRALGLNVVADLFRLLALAGEKLVDEVVPEAGVQLVVCPLARKAVGKASAGEFLGGECGHKTANKERISQKTKANTFYRPRCPSAL